MTNVSTPECQTFFEGSLRAEDSEISDIILQELHRQQDGIELIASENMVSRAVLEAQGSVFTNKYAEGLPERRYYGGCEAADLLENLARERLKKLFKADYVNVQPHCGSAANMAAYMVTLKPGDKVLGMSLNAGGHLTHGAKPNFSGKWFEAISYGVKEEDGTLDYEELESKARAERPGLIIAGGSAYARVIDFKRFRKIADEVGAFLMVDMAHFAGLVAAGLYPNPLEYADIVTSTTHKTLRGARGGIVLTNNADLAKKMNSAVFPGLQGGPLLHAIAGKAVTFGEALKPSFKEYQQQVLDNAKALADGLIAAGFDLVTGGTDTHLLLVDLRPKGITGKEAEDLLGKAGLTVNKNAIPFDPQKPMITSGIRLGSPAATTRGFGVEEFTQIAKWIDEALTEGRHKDSVIGKIRKEVSELTRRFPIYSRPWG
ncbi:serine hydroxymethyltransferase [Acetobacteraceae bacterium]|nr:serine hydroxymethyltransferase [Acetobacteraceae bacterium]